MNEQTINRLKRALVDLRSAVNEFEGIPVQTLESPDYDRILLLCADLKTTRDQIQSLINKNK